MPAWLGWQSVAEVRMFPSSIYFESSKWIWALTSDGDDVDNEGCYVTCPGAILFQVSSNTFSSSPAVIFLLAWVIVFVSPPLSPKQICCYPLPTQAEAEFQNCSFCESTTACSPVQQPMWPFAQPPIIWLVQDIHYVFLSQINQIPKSFAQRTV